MGGLSIWHILLFGVILLLLFGGGGKISDLMGDVAKGIKSFRQGLNEPDDTKTISGQANPPQPAPDKDKTSVGH